MDSYPLIFFNDFRITGVIILIASLIVLLVLVYLIFFKYESEITSLYPRNRNQMEIFIFKKLRMEFFKQDKQIDAIKTSLKIAMDCRNLLKRVTEEMKNIEPLYDDQKAIRNFDLEILRELYSSLEYLPNKLDNLISQKREFIYPEFFNMLLSLKENLKACHDTIKKIFALDLVDIDKNFFLNCLQKTEIYYLDIKDIHNNMISNFREKFSKGLK
jgi:hypothetical protein